MPVLMPSPVFRWFVPAQNGTGLVPAAGYKAKFYSAGTDIAKTIYELDDTPYPSPSNEAELNAEGFAGIKLGPGSYKLVVTDPDDAEVYTQDNINGDGAFGSGFVETVMPQDPAPSSGPNGLAQVDVANKFTWCGGYWAIGDGGHGFFWNETSSEPDDGGYVIASEVDPTVRWFREPDENGQVRAASFGYVGTRDEDLTDELLAAAGYCQANDKTLRIGPGSNATFGVSGQTYNFYILGGGIHFEPDAMITGNPGVTSLRLWGPISGPSMQIFTDIPIQIMTSQVLENPEWFGASRSAEDNTAALNRWLGAFGSEAPAGAGFILPPGTWDVAAGAGDLDWPESAPYILLGTVVGDEDFMHGCYFPSIRSVAKFAAFTLLNGANLTASGLADGAFSGRLLSQGLTATGTVLASSNVVAGNGGLEGSLYAGAGQSGFQFRAAGNLRTVYGSASTSSASLTKLLSTTLPADALQGSPGGDRLKIRAAGTMVLGSSNDQYRQFSVTIGGTDVFSATLIADTTNLTEWSEWDINAEVIRDGDGTFVCTGSIVTNLGEFPISAGSEITPCQSRCVATSGVDWSIPQEIAVYGAINVDGGGPVTGASITNLMLTVDFFPVNLESP